MKAFTAKEREVLQLLRDWRAWDTPFGGAASLDAVENLEAKGSYGPAGLIFAGAEFDRTDRRLLGESFGVLWHGLACLQRGKSVGAHNNGDNISGAKAYNALIEPYLADPADPSMVENLREKVRELDRQNALRAKRNKQPVVALVQPRRHLEAHDAAVGWLASNEPIRSADLHAIFAKRMSEKEEKKVENQNAEIYAVVQRLRVSGLKMADATKQAAEDFGVSTGTVERIIEFRDTLKKAVCKEPGCDREPFAQNLCSMHLQRQYRARRKKGA